MARYIAVDWYEDYSDPEVLGVDLSLEEAQELIDQRIEDTDGECDVAIYDSEMDKAVYDELYSRLYD